MKTILVVDDYPDAAEMLAELLRRQGYAAEAAGTAGAALERLQSNGIDAVILDEYLPGADGLTLLRTMRQQERLKSLPVLLWTAASVADFDALTRELEGLQPAAALRKPAEPERILLLLGALLDVPKGS